MSITSDEEDLSILLKCWQQGDDSALNELSDLVYHRLHQLANQCMWQERKNHTLQATALVNETYLQLLSGHFGFEDNDHFFNTAARMMRRILVDHARCRHSAKRGDGWQQVSLTEQPNRNIDGASLLALHQALDELAQFDPQKAEILELQFFIGLSVPQIAKIYHVSSKTIERNSKLARAWLQLTL